MNSTSNIGKIVPAILKAQQSMGAATKGAKNPFFKSNYADYGSVLEACKELLNGNGVLILQPHVFHDGKNFVETTLIHESGEWISSETEVVCAKTNDPQAFGSALTYSRRYGLQSLVALPAEDDDGEGAMARTYSTKPKPVTASVTAVQSVSSTVPAPAATVADIPRKSWKRPVTATTPVANGSTDDYS